MSFIPAVTTVCRDQSKTQEWVFRVSGPAPPARFIHPFYLRLYNAGLLNRDFDYDIDFSVQIGTVYIRGESKEPEKVYEELLGEIERIGKAGFDEAFFNRTLRSTIGGRLRSLEDFEDVCINMTSAYFDGFDSFDSFELLSSITRKDCEDWVRDNLKEDRFAVSLVTPVQ